MPSDRLKPPSFNAKVVTMQPGTHTAVFSYAEAEKVLSKKYGMSSEMKAMFNGLVKQCVEYYKKTGEPHPMLNRSQYASYTLTEYYPWQT